VFIILETFGLRHYYVLPEALCWSDLRKRQTMLPYRTLPSGWAGCYTCPPLRPYQFGPMRNPDVTKGHSDRLWSRKITSHLGVV